MCVFDGKVITCGITNYYSSYDILKCFILHSFISFSSNLFIDNNKFVLRNDSDTSLAISRDFMNTKCEMTKLPMFYHYKNKVCMIKYVRYFEVKAGYGDFSVGVFDQDNWTDFQNRPIGSNDNSIGFHSNKWDIYSKYMYENGNETDIYDCDNFVNSVDKVNVVGCGVYITWNYHNIVFFTLNGHFVGRCRADFINFGAAVCIANTSYFEVNDGQNENFLFNPLFFFNHLERQYMVTVSKYFKTARDFANISLVCKKYKEILYDLNENYVHLPVKCFQYFKALKTVNVWSHKDFQDIFNYYLKSEKPLPQFVIWFPVTHDYAKEFEGQNIVFKTICYTSSDFDKYGSNIPNNVCGIAALNDVDDVTCDNQNVIKINKKVLQIRSFVIPDNVTMLGLLEFNSFTNLCDIKMSKNLKRIGAYTFKNCISLTSIVLPENLKQIEMLAFQNCKQLSKIELSSSLTYLGIAAFNNCEKLKEIELPEQLDYLDEGVFSSCVSLTKVVIPKSVSFIGRFCFFNCGFVHFPEINVNVKTLSFGCFACCKSLVKINIPDTVTFLEDDCFFGCKKLETLVLPSRLKSIGRYCFLKCEKLINVKAPKTVKTIKENAFPINTNIILDK
ncbi:hypothetical protein EIN_437240 [Entamoeba invadens IP1]|uniref:B30.2/SPRY domain-containing protein n=1 Tax=Entamoeba invadens IP1 TaxID=370355 RepID=A0A0A1U9K0_ENTIV|nr:hypothetical protein EIN_437240 [Entamoeba invadens IP1]ELP88784.1 hypothetical protein EIN_437240 [Entamoeba invadens IP1]|eukprot:XP_004255555.1 hypothetical protein EIN_437240 [Entamoeba invadens IP1]